VLDLYTDYLITSTKYTTATGLAKIFGDSLSYDAVTRFLATENLENKKLWSFIKPILRRVEKEDSVIIVKEQSVIGISAVNLIHETDTVSLPLSMSIVHKDKIVIKKSEKVVRPRMNYFKGNSYKQSIMRSNLKLYWVIFGMEMLKTWI